MIQDPLFLSSLLESLLLFPVFLFAITISFYIPGRVILGNSIASIESNFTKLVLILIVGIVLWGYQGVLFGYFQVRFLTYCANYKTLSTF